MKYGIDAPNVVRNLALIGGIFIFAASFILFRYDNTKYIYFAFAAFFCFGLNFLIPSILMIFSSMVGKAYVLKNLVNELDIKGNELILDIGCGRGMLSIIAARKLNKGQVIGIDIWSKKDQSNNSLQATMKNVVNEGVEGRFTAETCDMRQLKYQDNLFDIIISSLAIHNIENHNERTKALSEIARVLKPGGRIALLDFQHVSEYAQFYENMKWDVKVSKRDYRMFPPVRILTCSKPNFV